MIEIRRDIITKKLDRFWEKDVRDFPGTVRAFVTRKEKSIHLYLAELTEPPVSPAPAVPQSLADGIEINILSKDNRTYFEQYLAVRKEMWSQEYLNSSLAQGCLGFLLVRNGEIIGSAFLAFREFTSRFFELDYLLENNQIYVADFYIAPKCRAGNLATTLKKSLVRFAQEHNYRCLIMATYRNNPRIYERIGFKNVGRILFVEQFFAKWYRFSKNTSLGKNRLSFRTFGKQINIL